jgi:hypothetical protein
MPFNKATLKSALIAAFDAAKGNTDDAEAAVDALSEAISDEIAAQVKACIESTIVTSVAVPALVSPAGPVTGTIVITNTQAATVV